MQKNQIQFIFKILKFVIPQHSEVQKSKFNGKIFKYTVRHTVENSKI